jgi:hypothetical protein|tara:strand:- start:1142 stop:1324 length:183 start_codon:yes stop_codon:yes gene_type:complete
LNKNARTLRDVLDEDKDVHKEEEEEEMSGKYAMRAVKHARNDKMTVAVATKQQNAVKGVC